MSLEDLGMEHQLTLNTADLSSFQIRRDFLRDPACEDESYVRQYDRTTLWYDAFWRNGRVILVCPKLKNFEPVVRSSQFHLDQKPVRISRVRHFSRHDIIELKSRRCPQTVSITSDEFEIATSVTRAELPRFANLNAHFTMSLNNNLEWIRDFASFHVRTQGLQAMVLFDNGSTDYPVSAIEERLRGVGLVDFLVVSVPLPYGRTVRKTENHDGRAQFLHTSLMNIARLRLLGHSRAVLNVDIDELVWSDGASVFDKAATSWKGFATFRGEWRHPINRYAKRSFHADHDHVDIQPGDCPRKYCINPRGLLGWKSWDVHSLEPLRIEKLLRLSKRHRTDIGYLHCSRVTTDWKFQAGGGTHPSGIARRKTDERETQFDPVTRAILDSALSRRRAG